MAKKRKKKQSLLWKAIKLFFGGIWFIIKNIALLLWKLFKFFIDKVDERRKARKLSKDPVYTAPSKFGSFKVIKDLAGSFKAFESKLHKESVIMLIFGKRGSGKSSLGFRILENIHKKTGRKCYALGIEQHFMPKWINPVEDVEKAANNSIVLVDEGAISFSSRESMSSKNKDLIKILAITRHKNLTLIFITQNTGLIDKSILKLVDILFVKEGSLLQTDMERPELKKFYEKANSSFKEAQGNKKKYAYIIDDDFEGFVSYRLPSFWSSKLSKNKAA